MQAEENNTPTELPTNTAPSLTESEATMPSCGQTLAIRALLKKETSELHDQLDGQVSRQIKAIKTPEESLSFYTQLLESTLGIVLPLEGHIHKGKLRAELEASGVEISSMERANLIVSDLLNLDRSQDYIDSLSQIEANMLPEINSLAQAAGALYVLEGSNVGGPVIAQMLSKKIWNGNGSHNFEFFNANGSFLDARTKFNEITMPILSSLVRTDQERAEAVKTAKETFKAFISWFEA